nr:hypothetical protein [uncultured Undibacterium sp.]
MTTILLELSGNIFLCCSQQTKMATEKSVAIHAQKSIYSVH